jgi:hypothetical protein
MLGAKMAAEALFSDRLAIFGTRGQHIFICGKALRISLKKRLDTSVAPLSRAFDCVSSCSSAPQPVGSPGDRLWHTAAVDLWHRWSSPITGNRTGLPVPPCCSRWPMAQSCHSMPLRFLKKARRAAPLLSQKRAGAALAVLLLQLC